MAKMNPMLRNRFKPQLLITVIAVTALIVATIALRNAPENITAAVILALVMLAGIGVGASVDLHSPPRRRH